MDAQPCRQEDDTEQCPHLFSPDEHSDTDCVPCSILIVDYKVDLASLGSSRLCLASWG